MQTVILCNTLTPSLSPIAENKPAAACSVLNRPLLAHILEKLSKNGFSRFTVVTPEGCGELLYETESLAELYDLKIYTSSETEPRILRRAWLGGDMLAVSGNVSGLCDLKELLRLHNEKNSPLTFSVSSNSKAPFFANEKPSTEFSPKGVYILSEETVSSLPLDTKIRSLEELVRFTPQSLAVPDESEAFEIKTTGDYLKANAAYLKNASDTPCKAFEMSDGFFNKSGRFLHGVTVIPPVYVGENTRIGRGTVLDSGTVICDNVTVGEGCYIRGSVIEKNASIGDRANLENAVVCRGAQIMKGVECKKMSVVGMQSVVGENTVLKPGVRVWGGKRISEALTVSKDVYKENDAKLTFDDDGSINDICGFMTPVFSAQLGMAVASALEAGSYVAVSYNGKQGAKILSDALSAGLCASGANVWLMPEASKGELLFALGETDSELGIEISSDFKTSVRVFSKGGLKIPEGLEKQIEENLNHSLFRISSEKDSGKISDASGFKSLYIKRLSEKLPCCFDGLNVKIKTSDMRLAKIADGIFPERNDVNGEQVTFHLNPAGEGASAYSEKTGYVFYEKLVLIAAKYKLDNGESISLPETFPDAAEKLSENTPGSIFRYSLTSDGYFDESARKIAAKSSNSFVNDPLVLCAEIISVMQNKNLSLRQLSQDLPKFYTTQRFVVIDTNSNGIMISKNLHSPDNLARAVVRTVKNGKGALIYAQAEKAETATAFCDELENKLKQLKSVDFFGEK